MSKNNIFNTLLEAAEEVGKTPREEIPRFMMFAGPNEPLEELFKSNGGELFETVDNGDGTTYLTYKF